jgi:hypothetical protein
MITPWMLLTGITAAAIVGLALHGPIPQNPEYHQFADRRSILGIPNFWNVISNASFLVAGLAGLQAIAGNGAQLLSSACAYFVFFLSVTLVAVGSAYYHLAPDNCRLTWDRLPMALAFVSYLAIVVGERIHARLALALLPFLLLTAAGSVAYWHVSERRGRGDLRPYLIVQFLPLVLVPLITLLYPAPLAENYPIWGMVAASATAKLVESLDGQIFRMNGAISGHTLKHLIAAAGVYLVVRALL